MTEPITLATVKNWIKVEITDDDELIQSLITEARKWVENQTGVAIIEQTIVNRYDIFPTEMSPHLTPIKSITSIQYYDSDGTLQTLDSSKYQVDLGTMQQAGRIQPAYGESWPSTQTGRLNAVILTSLVGLDATNDAADISVLSRGIMLKIAEMYVNRQDQPAPDKRTQLGTITHAYKVHR